MRRLRVPVLLLLTLLATPWSAAAEPADFFSRLLRLLPGLWEKAGCLIDPDGQCAPVAPDAGCIIDPNGGCIGDK